VLVEQYHYGKVAAAKTRATLGKDMPLVEYTQEPSRFYVNDSNPLRRPFDLLVDHLTYALSHARILVVWPG